MVIPYVFRRCTKCGRWLVASSVNFHKSKKGKYGLMAECKECRNKYREANKEHIAEYNKKHYKANKEAIAEYNKKHYKANKEAIRKRNKQYREAHKEVEAERMRRWREANKEHEAEYRQSPQCQVIKFNSRNRRRAKEKNQGSGITKKQWLEMMSFFNWECAYSGKYLGGNTKDRTIDHIEPLNNGGENEIWNCIPMDKSLNSSKKDKEMLDWYIKQPFCTAERLLKIYNWQEYAKKKYANSIVNE